MTHKEHAPAPESAPQDTTAGNKHADSGQRSRATENQEATLPPLPTPTFSTFILSLASSVLVQLGEVPDPSTGEVRADLLVAKHTIDTLTMLQEKLKNGLSGKEIRLLEDLLYELRMKYIVKK